MKELYVFITIFLSKISSVSYPSKSSFLKISFENHKMLSSNRGININKTIDRFLNSRKNKSRDVGSISKNGGQLVGPSMNAKTILTKMKTSKKKLVQDRLMKIGVP